MSTLEEKIQRLTDIEDIKQLKFRYAAYCDQEYDEDGIASCFAEDGVWDGGEKFGVYNGREAIREYFSGSDDIMKFAMHYTTNPLIEIDGDTATGQWHLWQPMVLKENTQPIWLMAQYNDQFVRQDNKWLIKNLAVTAKSFTPHDTEFGV
jgi:hypothetical protein